jgi:hypothetical protein
VGATAARRGLPRAPAVGRAAGVWLAGLSIVALPFCALATPCLPLNHRASLVAHPPLSTSSIAHLALTPPPTVLSPSYLVIKRPWPSMLRTVAGDHARFEQTYFSHYKGYYFTGDGARRDEDGCGARAGGSGGGGCGDAVRSAARCFA